MDQATTIERNTEMIRNFKMLGGALVAVLAISAVVGSAASADEFTSEISPVTMTGQQAGAGDVITTTAGTVKCKQVGYSAGLVVTPTTAVTATPSYPLTTSGGEWNCTGFGFPAEVSTNGCVYRFTIFVSTFVGNFEILCPEGKEITVTAKSVGVVKCTLHIPAQTISSALTYRNVGAGNTREITITSNISTQLSYKHTAGTGIGACTSGSSITGSYTGEAIVTGQTVGGHVGIFLS